MRRLVTLRDVGQTFIKDSGESQQAVDLLLQGDAHGANVPLIHVLPLLQLFDDEEVGVWGAVERKTGLGVCHRQFFLVFSQKTSPSSHSVEIWAYGLCPNLPDTICMGLGSFVNRQLPFPGARPQTGHRPKRPLA